MIKIWLICIFKMAAKIAEIYLKWHIFLSSVHSFYCIGFKFSYTSLLELLLVICKCDSFAYSKWPPKRTMYSPDSIFCYRQSTVFIVWLSKFHIYRNLSSSWRYVNLAHLHNQYGCQNMLGTPCFHVWSPQFLLHGSKICIIILLAF